jgi:uncharacterized protein with HEPN domain
MKTELTPQEKLEKVLEAYHILEEYVCEVNNYDFEDNEGTKEMIDYANELVEEATR